MKRILHVEDDEMVQRAIGRMLLLMGHIVEPVDRISAVPQDLKAYDLVITDGRLPDGTGIEVVNRANGQHVPAVIYSSDTEVQRQAAENAMLFVEKPGHQELMMVVDRLLAAAERCRTHENVSAP